MSDAVLRALNAQDADKFWRMPEAYLRGNTIKYIRVPDEVSFEGQPWRNIRKISPVQYHTM